MAAKSTISLGIEVTGAQAFQAQLKACDTETKALSAEMTRLSQSTSLLDKGLPGMAQKMQTLGSSLQNSKDKLALLNNELPKAQQSLNALAVELEKAKNSGDSAAIERATTAYEKQRTTVANLETNISKTRTEIDRTTQSMQQMVTGAIVNGFNTLKNATAGIAEGFAKVGKAAAEAATAIIDKMNKAVTGLTAAGTAVVLGLGKVGLEYNSQMEKYVTNFTTLLGSTEAAAKKVEELKKMAAATPFGMEDLAQATQTLLSFGVQADKTTPILKALGDVSLGNKERFQSLALAFGQVSSSGKLTGQDLNQMINAGFNPLNEISKRTGESMEQLRDRMSKGGITAKEVEQAFIDATSAGGQFAGGMESASKTMDGMISTLKDNAKALVGQVFEPISNSIKQTLLPAAIGYIEDLTNAFQTKGLNGLIKAAGDILDGIVKKVEQEGPQIVNKTFEVVTQILQRLNQSMPEMVRVGGELMSSIMNGLQNTLPQLGPIAAEVAPLIVKTIISYKSTLLDTGIQIIVAIVDGLAKDMPSIIQTMQEGLNKTIDTILNNLPKFLDSAGKILESLVKGLLDNMPKIVDAITKIINEMVNWIVQHLDLIIDAAVKIMGALIQGLVGAIPNLVANLPKIVMAIVNGIGAAVGEVFNIGVKIVQGIWDGIKSVGNWLGQQISGFFSGIIDGAKKMLGIHSPSRVFAGIGENIGLGLAEGIRDTAGLVQAAMDYILPSAGNIALGMDSASVAGRVVENNGGLMPWMDDRPIILTLNDRELGRAVRGYA